jgi:hypothetical protein
VIGQSLRPLPDNTRDSHEIFISLAGIKPANPASERPQTPAIDRLAIYFYIFLQHIPISPRLVAPLNMKNIKIF